MTCAEFKDLAGALALDALDEEERAAALAHLAQAAHEGCHEALARARTTAGLLSGALADVEPSPLVWRRIASRLNPRRRWAVASGWLAAAAALVVVAILAGRSARLGTELDAARRQAEAMQTRASSSEGLARECAAQLETARRTSGLAREAIALLQRPGSRLLTFAPQGGFEGRATAIVGADARRAILLSSALVPTASRDYQLWVIPRAKGAAPIPAGLVASAEGIGLGDFQPGILARGAAALAVSAEPKGGSPTGAPTQVVLVAGLGG